jgi:cystine transport system substrate-binding protein
MPCGHAQGAGEGVLRVGVLAHYKPFSFIEGQLQGFDVDVMKRLASIMKLQLQIHVDGMATLQKKLQADEISVIGNQLLPTPENRRLFDFAKPYASNQLVCVQHEDDTRDFLSLDDLYGKKLGVLANTGVEEQARGVVGKTVLPFPSIDQALKQLAEKKLDAVLEESLIADFYIERDGLPVKITAPFAPPMASGLAVRKGNKEMAARLSAAIQTLLSDGSFKEISTRWFGYDVSRSNVSHSVPR